jgi:hypothetical protein
MDDSRTPETPQPSVSVSSALPGPTMPGRNGGVLRRGNPGNKSHTGERAAIAREILEASTPQAARILKHMSLKGERPPLKKGETAQPLSHVDHLRAVQSHLDRGGAPVVSAIGAAPGSGITVLLGVAAQAVQEAAETAPEEPTPLPQLPAHTSEPATPTVRAGAVPGTR